MPDLARTGEPSATPTSLPSPPPESSPAVRAVTQIREGLTDLAGFALAAYLVKVGAVTGPHALLFALALALPSQVLLRLAKIVAARGAAAAGARSAVALVAAASAYGQIKAGAVAFGGVAVAASCSAGAL